MMRLMQRPFRNIEIQTTGVRIDNTMLRFLRNHVGVNTISVSLFSFDADENRKCRKGPELDTAEFCKNIKLYDFNLRFSLNLTKYLRHSPEAIFETCKQFGADQVTLRKLYDADDGSPQSLWVKENKIDDASYEKLRSYVAAAPILRQLEYGQTAHNINGMSVVLDDDCMAKSSKAEIKYLIIRPNGKLYSSWDDPASLIF
jgi:sulfatase maturation enzyme AslB (radical SAM superfamily)